MLTCEVVRLIRQAHQTTPYSIMDILRRKAQFYFWRAKILTAQFFNTRAYIIPCMMGVHCTLYGNSNIGL